MSRRPDSGRGPAWTVDPRAFGELYEAHADALLVFLARRTYDPEVAVELTAETFAQAYLARGRFRGGTDEEAAAWLYAIARHLLARWLRRGRAERRAIERLALSVPTLDSDEHARIEELAGLGDLRRLVARELEKLSAEQRDALRLRVVEELPYRDVARRLAVSEETARARVSRGLRALAAALDRTLPGEGAA